MVLLRFGFKFVREGDSITHAANIVPQNGKLRPKSDAAPVSYQITDTLRVGIRGKKRSRSAAGGSRRVQRIEVFADYFAELLKSGCVLMGIDAADWNGRYQMP